MTETRETFAGLAQWEKGLWYALSALSVIVFVWGIARLVAKYRRSRGPARLDRFGARVRRAVRVVSSHSWIRRRDSVAGLAHLFVFYGFLVLFAGTCVLAVQDDIARPLFGFDFWHGAFYLGYSLFLDVFGAALTLGLVVFAAKRWLTRPRRLDYARPAPLPDPVDRARYAAGDVVFLGSLFFLAVSGFLLEALRIAQTLPSFERWSPVGWLAGHGLHAAGVGAAAAASAHHGLWWAHGVIALAFVAAIPYTKAVHMLAAPAAVAVRDAQGGTIPPVPAGARGAEVGYAFVEDLDWRHLLDLDACTKCGKCHVACPAAASGAPLSPRDVVLDLRELAEGAIGIRSRLRVGPLFDESTSIFDVVRPETAWACTTCMACVEICPVGIEHVPIIVQLRRQLVERGELDGQLQSTLETIYTTGNSFGEPKRKRARWARELPFDVKDARKEPVEVLWFVGDYASFDARNQLVTRALARILHHADVDFGILHDGERNAGFDVRRAGEEGLFAMLASENLKTIAGCDFERVVTSDPHSLHALKHEYRDLGADWSVLHHSELLLELFEHGRLEPVPLGAVATYHDPCTLGRYGGIYDAPRRVLELIGVDLREMPRNRDNSFCCGAGGGRIWMNEQRTPGRVRPSEQRIEEALQVPDVELFVVACPKDVTMYEDAVKTSGAEGRIRVVEISELVLEALHLPAPAPSNTLTAQTESP